METKKYLEQFDLTQQEMGLKILNCAALELVQPANESKAFNILTIPPNEVFQLPYQEQYFDLGLCFDTIFTQENLSEDLILKAIAELTRVATEVRILPLVNKLGKPSPYLGPVLMALQQKGYGAELREIKNQGDKKSHALLRVWNESCEV